MVTTDVKYYRPATIREISDILERNHQVRFIAGGTDVMVNRQQANDESNILIDITGIKGLGEISITEDQLHIGSLVTLSEIECSSLVQKHFPVLVEAVKAVASPVIRQTATIGGNLLCENRCVFYNQSEFWREAAGYCLKCNGDICIATGGTKACFSKFVSDTAIALISLDATVGLVNREVATTIKVSELYSNEGVNPKAIQDNELITGISLSLKENYRTVFKKLRPRKTLDFTSLTTSVAVNNNGDIRIAVGGVDPGPVVITGNVDEDFDALAKRAAKKARVVDNDVYPRKYRKEMIGIFLKKSLDELN